MRDTLVCHVTLRRLCLDLTSPSPGLTLVMCTSSRRASSLLEESAVAWTVLWQTLFRARD